MTKKTTTSPLDRLALDKLPPIECAFWNCPKPGELVHRTSPATKYHPEPCALMAALERAEERKAKARAAGKPVSGDGSQVARKKEHEHRLFIAEEAAKAVARGADPDSAAERALAKLKKDRPDLTFGNQHGTPHRKPLRPGDPRIARATELADSMPRFSWLRLAEVVDGTSKTSSSFQNYHSACLKGFQDDPAFVEAIDNAMARNADVLDDAAYQEAVVGKQVPIVSMGQVIAHQHVRDTKLLSQLLKVSNREFFKANSAAGSNIQVNINNGAAQANPDDPENPLFFFSYYETLKLTDDERRQLSELATKIISGRTKEPVVVDLTPDARTKMLMNDARANAEDVEIQEDYSDV